MCPGFHTLICKVFAVNIYVALVGHFHKLQAQANWFMAVINDTYVNQVTNNG